MEKKKINYIIYIVAGLCVFLLLAAFYKAEKNHEKRLYLVVNKKIKEAARDCYLKKECEGKITLNDLYEKDYLKTIIDPVTKEVMDNTLCIEYIEDRAEFCK